MFAKHNFLKSNHANAYRVLAQTSLCPAESPALQGLSMGMIQSLGIEHAIVRWQSVQPQTGLGIYKNLGADQRNLVKQAEGFSGHARQRTIRYQHSLSGGSPG